MKEEKEARMHNDVRKRALDEASRAGSSSAKAEKKKRSSQACVYCQRLKMKCSGTMPCERCVRVGRECKLPEVAVRQPWSKKKDQEIQLLNNRLQEMEKKLHEQEGYPSGSSDGAASSSSPQKLSNGLAGTNDFSTPATSAASTSTRTEDSRRSCPFVTSGSITLDEAKELFELFMHNCALHVALVDPEWHSYSRVSKDCPFLLACVIFIASGYHHSRATLREELKPEMNSMVGSIITSGQKSVGIVQGFLLLYFFNQPPANAEQDTAWLYSGIAIRIASELNLGSTSRQGNETVRERIDRERTWILTFIVDRSLSTTRGKAWTIRGDDNVVRHCSTWSDQPASRAWDLAICTLADLLKVTSRQIDALNTNLSAKSEFDESFDCETMMRIMNEELEEWRRRWHARGTFNSPFEGVDTGSSSSNNHNPGGGGSNYSSPMTEVTDVHKRTFHYLSKQGVLRYNYAVLVLNCFGLQYCATHPNTAAAKTYSLTQAIRAAQNVVRCAKDGLRYTVAYSPHSQCTIVTFAIVSLIKLASLKRDDQVVSQRLLRQVESGITFLESVAIRPTHVAARSASFLRGLLRKSLQSDYAESSFRPGMEVHSLPVRSSRPGSPLREILSMQGDSMAQQQQQPQQQQQHHLQKRQSHGYPPFPSHDFSQLQQQQQQQLQDLQNQQQQYQQTHYAASQAHNNDTAVDGSTLHDHTLATTPQQQLFTNGQASLDPGGGTTPMGNMTTTINWNFENDAALDLLASADPSMLFGMEGTTGFGGLTADELLNDSFWLRLPQRSPN